jgi:hypothetical protein
MRIIKLGRKYVYAHSLCGSIFYIGMGSLGRAYQECSHNPVWKKIVESAGVYEVDLLYETDVEADARRVEKMEILRRRPSANIDLLHPKRRAARSARWA